MSVDPQTCTDAELRRRMKRYAKLEPTYLAAMMESEARLFVPKRDIPYPKLEKFDYVTSDGRTIQISM